MDFIFCYKPHYLAAIDRFYKPGQRLGINVSPRSRCIHAINAKRENNEAQTSTETQNNVTASGEGVDPNPSKIP